MPNTNSRVKVCVCEPPGTPVVDEFKDFQRLVALDKSQCYSIANDPKDADITVVVSVRRKEDRWQYECLTNFLNRFPSLESVFVYVEDDTPRCVQQGLYCSMPRRWMNRDRQRSVAYRTIWNPYVLESANCVDVGLPRWDLSFVGQFNNGLRRSLASISMGGLYLEDTSQLNIYDKISASRLEEAQRHFVEVISDSKFVLCPRGMGTSSFRLFETLALGRVPIVISDQYVFPSGPEWQSFSVQIPERRLNSIPIIIAELESQWVSMARRARAAYQDWFAPDILFHRMMEQCIEIKEQKRLPERIWRRLPTRQQFVLRMRASASKVFRSLGGPARART